MLRSLFLRLSVRVLAPIRRIMSGFLVDDRSLVGGSSTFRENPLFSTRRARLEARLARAAEQPSVWYSQPSVITYSSCVGPMAAAFWGVGTELLWQISRGTGESERLGTDIFVKNVELNGVLTTANGDNFDTNGAFARLVIAYAEGNNILYDPSGSWRSERLFKNQTPYNQAALVTGALVDDNPRFCVLYDSGLHQIGGTKNAPIKELSFKVPCGFRTVYSTTITNGPLDIVQGQLLAFIFAMQAGENASVNTSPTPKQIWWTGGITVEFSNIQ